MGIWFCTHLPWHRFVVRKRVSNDSERITCSCGRMYGVNHNVRAILPWDDVKEFYERMDRTEHGKTGVNGVQTTPPKQD